MSRITRSTTIGIRVSKTPSVKKASGRFKKVAAAMPVDGLEPRVIDKTSHKKFVKNVFAIRGRTAMVA